MWLHGFGIDCCLFENDMNHQISQLNTVVLCIPSMFPLENNCTTLDCELVWEVVACSCDKLKLSVHKVERHLCHLTCHPMQGIHVLSKSLGGLYI